MIIDAHIHLEDYFTKAYEPEQRLENLKKCMEDAKIDKAVIFEDPCATNYSYLDADKIIDLIKNETHLFLVAGVKVTNNMRKEVARLSRLLKEKKIVGIKLYPGYQSFYPQDERCNKIYDLAEKYDVPVLFHSGDTFGAKAPIKYSEPMHIDELAFNRPNLKIIIAHAGVPWFDQTMVILDRNRNVYADISGLVWDGFNTKEGKYTAESLKRLIAWGSGKKLLFGTDWPCCEAKAYHTFMKDYVKFVKRLRLDKKIKNLVFYENAQKLFKIP